METRETWSAKVYKMCQTEILEGQSTVEFTHLIKILLIS